MKALALIQLLADAVIEHGDQEVTIQLGDEPRQNIHGFWGDVNKVYIGPVTGRIVMDARTKVDQHQPPIGV